MSPTEKSYLETDTDGRPLQLGDYYEVAYGPASSLERTSAGTLIEIDLESSSYTFEADDGSEFTVADDAIDSVRRVERPG